MGRTIYRRQNQSLDFDTRVVRTITTGDIVTLAEVKNYLRIDNTADDDLITNMIAQAENMVENYLSRDIRSKERELFYPYIDRDVELLWAPINTSVTVTAEDETGTAIENIEVLGFADPIVRFTISPLHNVTIKYTTAALEADSVRQALFAMVWNMHPNTAKDPQPWMPLLAPYKNTSWI